MADYSCNQKLQLMQMVLKMNLSQILMLRFSATQKSLDSTISGLACKDGSQRLQERPSKAASEAVCRLSIGAFLMQFLKEEIWEGKNLATDAKIAKPKKLFY